MLTIAAKWFHEGRRGEVPRLIVIHCTVSPESGTGAEAVARYFQSGTRKASAHRTCDNNSTVISVADSDTAFAAAGANRDGLHLELVGQPSQTRAEWLDAFSTAELFQAGLTVREWSARYGIPLRWLTVAQVADGRTKGLCTHHDVSRAFPDVSTGHWDPGPDFPKDEALRIWTPESEPPVTSLEENTMYFVSAKANNHVWFFEPGRRTLVNNKDDRAAIAKAAGIPNTVAEVSDPCFASLADGRTTHQ